MKVTEIFDVTEADENAESNNVAELREQTDETRILIDEDDCDEWGDENEPLANAWVTSNSEEGRFDKSLPLPLNPSQTT